MVMQAQEAYISYDNMIKCGFLIKYKFHSKKVEDVVRLVYTQRANYTAAQWFIHSVYTKPMFLYDYGM